MSTVPVGYSDRIAKACNRKESTRSNCKLPKPGSVDSVFDWKVPIHQLFIDLVPETPQLDRSFIVARPTGWRVEHPQRCTFENWNFWLGNFKGFLGGFPVGRLNVEHAGIQALNMQEFKPTWSFSSSMLAFRFCIRKVGHVLMFIDTCM